MEHKGKSKGEIVNAIVHFAQAAMQKGNGKDGGKAAEVVPKESGGCGGSRLPAAFANVRAVPVEVGPLPTAMAAAPPPPPPAPEPADLRDLVYFHFSCFVFFPNLYFNHHT